MDCSQANTKPSTTTPLAGHYKSKQRSTAHLNRSPDWGFPCLSPDQRDGCVATSASMYRGSQKALKVLYKVMAVFLFPSIQQLKVLML